jgi:SAM-dependent methyltransferase
MAGSTLTALGTAAGGGPGMGGTSDHLRLWTANGSVPLGYVRSVETIYLVARDRAAQWPVDALRAGRVDVDLPTGRESGAVSLITDPAERSRVLALFQAKYGPEGFRRWYDRPARVLELRLGRDPGDASESRYAVWLESEFDNVADDYDRHISGNRMNRLLRDRSLERLHPLFATARRLVEVGCGSGMETLPLLRAGHEVLAVDISQRMLEVVGAKARREGLSEQVRLVKLRASELDRLADELGEGAVDGGYSTYGALNCEPALAPVAGPLGRLIRPGGPFLAGVYNRWCLFELAGYSLSLQPHRAFGRRHRPVPVGSSRFCIDVYAYSPAQVRRAFGPWFVAGPVEGVPVVLPPSDLAVYAEKFSARFRTLAAGDAWVGRRWPFRNLGDHFLMTLYRRPFGTGDSTTSGECGPPGRDAGRAAPPRPPRAEVK